MNTGGGPAAIHEVNSADGVNEDTVEFSGGKIFPGLVVGETEGWCARMCGVWGVGGGIHALACVGRILYVRA